MVTGNPVYLLQASMPFDVICLTLPVASTGSMAQQAPVSHILPGATVADEVVLGHTSSKLLRLDQDSFDILTFSKVK